MVSMLVVACLSYPAMRLYARRVEGSDTDAVEKVHRLRRGNLIYILLVLLSMGGFAIEASYEAELFTGWVAAVAGIAPFVLIIAAFLGAYLGVRPTYERLRGIEGKAGGARRRMVRLLLAMLLPTVIGGAVSLLFLLFDPSPVVLGCAFVVVIVVVAASGPLVVMAAMRTRAPDPASKVRLQRLCAEHDVRIRRVRVIETRHDPTVNAMFSGFGPGPKYVFVTDELLETFPPDELAAVVAHEIGHRKKHHILLKLTTHLGTVLVLAAIGLGIGTFDSGGVWEGPLAFALPVVFIGSLLIVQGVVGIRLERHADDYAAATVGKEPLCRALERLAEKNMVKRRTSWFWNVMQQHPGLESRISRLAD